MIFLGADIPLVMRIAPGGGKRLSGSEATVEGTAASPRRIRIPGAIIGPPVAAVESRPTVTHGPVAVD